MQNISLTEYIKFNGSLIGERGTMKTIVPSCRWIVANRFSIEACSTGAQIISSTTVIILLYHYTTVTWILDIFNIFDLWTRTRDNEVWTNFKIDNTSINTAQAVCLFLLDRMSVA